MAKLSPRLALHFLAGILVLTGTGSILNGIWPALHAQLTGNGAIVLPTGPTETALMEGGIHAAAPLTTQDPVNGIQILLGLLVFFLGFGLHSFLVIQRETQKKKKKGPMGFIEHYWVKIWP